MARFRLCADGFIDLRDTRRVRTPGAFESRVEPAGESEAISFLLSHSFPGHRRVVRPLSVSDRRQLRLAMWANSVQERMNLADRVWRSVTEPVPPPPEGSGPILIQILKHGKRSYPLYLDGRVTRVIPPGGIALESDAPALDLKTA
ncbi:MAG TPA: hypothetical protein VMN39_06555 [Longimicrobiaceae bacterium]|nr:hypothetical protein [Longimicrobiaceae bacterium]